MPSPYGYGIAAWERRLNRVDQDRRVTPFEWGTNWLQQTPVNGMPVVADQAPAETVMPALEQWNRAVLAESAQFFSYAPVDEYHLDGDVLTFPSPVATTEPENRNVHARWFPAADKRRAVVVVAQWNANEQGHLGLCSLLQRAGISALRVSMPYHDRRMPARLKRAEFTVDPNIGRTIHAARQAVCDIRAAVDWLEHQDYGALGIMGTSLGSCYALLASAHDSRLRVNVYNHVSEYFGDVVWTGLATAHVRAGIEGNLDRAQLREAWRVISPASYLDAYSAMSARAGKKSLLIWTRYDPCFLPEFSRRVVAEFHRRRLDFVARSLPCGHYTIGKAPFSYLDAYLITRFLARNL